MSAETPPPRHGPACGVTGATGGFFSGITGVGGGAIMIPLLTGVLGMPQHRAHGTSLVVITFAAATGVAVYAWSTSIDWTLVATLLAGSMVGAYLGARGAHRLPGMRLRQLFGAFLVLVALRLVLVEPTNPMLDAAGLTWLIFGAGLGLLGGVAAGALGIGGGALFVPGMVVVLGTGQHEAQGVSLAVIVLTASVGALTHARHGTVDVRAAAWLVPSSIPASGLGAGAAAALGTFALQRIFAAVILAVGIQMLASATLRIRRERGLETPSEADRV